VQAVTVVPGRRIPGEEDAVAIPVLHQKQIKQLDDVRDVLFTDCDVIRDTGREWSLRVFHADGATVRDVRFENIRVEESRRLISLWIGRAVWSRDAERGHIRGVTFQKIRASGGPLRVELHGFDAEHAIEDVTFRDVLLNGKPLTLAGVAANAFVRQTRVEP